MDYMYALPWKLLIIGLLLEYFATLLKRLYLKKENSCKIFHISSSIVPFSYGMVKNVFFGDKISSGEAKERGNRPKMRVIFVKFPLLSKIQGLSHKLSVRQTSTHHHCNWHAQKPICWDFQVIWSSSSLSKTTLCIFKEQIWLPNGKCYRKKINSTLTRKKLEMLWKK